MSRSTLFFALPVRSSWVSDGTVSHRAIGSPPPAADPRGEQSSIRALSTWNRATVGRRIKLLGHPFISGAIRTLCAPSVSRETAGSGYHPSSFDIRYPATVPASQQRLQIDGPSLGAAAGWRSTSHADLTASIKPMARSPPASLERRKHGTSHAHRHPEPLASYLRFHVKPALHSSCARHSRNTPTACEVRLYEAQDKRFRHLLQSASSSQARIRTASLQQDRFSPALTFSTLKDYLFSSLPRRRMPASRQ